MIIAINYQVIDLGFELSPTIYIEENADNAAGAIVGTFFGTLFNIPKINVGFSYYFPIKKY